MTKETQDVKQDKRENKHAFPLNQVFDTRGRKVDLTSYTKYHRICYSPSDGKILIKSGYMPARSDERLKDGKFVVMTKIEATKRFPEKFYFEGQNIYDNTKPRTLTVILTPEQIAFCYRHNAEAGVYIRELINKQMQAENYGDNENKADGKGE